MLFGSQHPDCGRILMPGPFTVLAAEGGVRPGVYAGLGEVAYLRMSGPFYGPPRCVGTSSVGRPEQEDRGTGLTA